MTGFYRILEIQTQVLMLVWPALSVQRQLPPPLSISNARTELAVTCTAVSMGIHSVAYSKTVAEVRKEESGFPWKHYSAFLCFSMEILQRLLLLLGSDHFELTYTN